MQVILFRILNSLNSAYNWKTAWSEYFENNVEKVAVGQKKEEDENEPAYTTLSIGLIHFETWHRFTII